jgi:DNA-binding transcriptional LysR family regulator
MNIELRHLRAIVAVAEELNFTRAAERLFIAQQALSNQIRQAENELGVRLFDRSTRHVALTPAGEEFSERAAQILASVEDAGRAAQEVAQPRTALKVGFVASVEHSAFAHIVAEFERRRPDVDVFITFGDTTEPTGGLRTRETDVAFVYGPFDRSGLETSLLFTEPVGIVMAADHPLAALEDLTLERALAEPTFDFTTGDRAWRDYWMAIPHRRGKPPIVVAHFKTLDALVEALRARLGVHTGTRSLADLGGGALVWREMADLQPLEHFVAWRAGDDRSEVTDFVATSVESFSTPAA